MNDDEQIIEEGDHCFHRATKQKREHRKNDQVTVTCCYCGIQTAAWRVHGKFSTDMAFEQPNLKKWCGSNSCRDCGKKNITAAHTCIVLP